jgi:alcohol dehydrogenase (NADP+)
VRCKEGKEPYCDKGMVGTYAGRYKKGNGKGDKSFGGTSRPSPSFLHLLLPAVSVLHAYPRDQWWLIVSLLIGSGYANYHRAPGHFVIPIPDGLDPYVSSRSQSLVYSHTVSAAENSSFFCSALAAPMLCGGVTMYAPLKQYGAGTERKDVGIVGIGGLGYVL